MTDKIRILIVDDELEIGEFISDIAADMGFDAVAIQHASKFEEIYSDDFELVILDLVMPDRDGVELLRHMASHHASAGVILISGYDYGVLHSAQKLAVEYGLNVIASLSKPLVHEELEKLFGEITTTIKKPSGNPFQSQELFNKKDLQQAIRMGELSPWYQPQLDMKTGNTVGVEALIRWNHPQRGLLMPGIIIPLAERSNMMDELTNVVVEQSFQQLCTWHKQGVHLNLSINLPANRLKNLEIPEQISKKIKQFKLRPEQIVVEVTESGLMQDLAKSLDVLTRLRMKRIGLSIDDFGTGYSSMAQLYCAPFSELKIDQSFVKHATRDAEALTMVEITILLGHKLDMTVVAEGVEDKETWDLLSRLGCDVAQGYYIAKPMPAEQLPDWINRQEI